MKNLLTKEQIICERMDANTKTLMAMMEISSGSIEELQKVTKLDKIKSFQATATLWLLGVIRWVDPKTKEVKDATKNIEDYGNKLKKWDVVGNKFENDAEYLFATIELLPGSTFKELRVLTGLNEHSLCSAITWLGTNGRIIMDENGSDEDSEDEMYFLAGIFDMK